MKSRLDQRFEDRAIATLDLFIACCPLDQEEGPANWSEADRAWLRQVLARPEGQRLLAVLRSAVHVAERRACSTPDNGDFHRGVGHGFRRSLAHLLELSVASPPQKQEGPEFGLPGAQDDLERRLTP